MANQSNILAMVTGMLVVVLIYLFFFNPTPTSEIKIVEILKRDTIFIPAEPIVIKEAVPQIRYVKDTLIITKPFIAELDTIVKFDTIYVSYRYPENLMNLWIRPKPDTLFKDTILITQTITEERSVWTDILTHTAVGILGFLLGGLK